MRRKPQHPQADTGPKASNSDAKQEDFYSRWSRRKRSHSEPTATMPTPEVTTETEYVPPEKTDADMPPLESLNEGSDFSGFMSPQVSEKLRKAALRKLFNLPQFNVRDGLDDYDEDFTSFEALGNVLTADRRHQLELEQEQVMDKDSSSDDAKDSLLSPPGASGGNEEKLAEADQEDDNALAPADAGPKEHIDNNRTHTNDES